MWQVDSEWIGLRGHQCVVAGRRPRVLAKQKSPRKRVSRRIERRFRGRVNIALSAISRCYNTRRSVHDNILQPSINYHQVWPIGGRRVGMWQESRDRSEGLLRHGSEAAGDAWSAISHKGPGVCRGRGAGRRPARIRRPGPAPIYM